ncbi:MAG: indole-3-glycerol phosphate synthase TrpC [Flavobacteriaceae bacterium]
MNILNKIVADKKVEVIQKKKLLPISYLETSPLFDRHCKSLVKKIKINDFGIIAEFKRRSPSKKNINSSLSVTNVAKEYEEAGVSGISVLTDGKYFSGSLDDLILSRSIINLPLLRKDFIIDEYQIIEAKANGADVILLIAAVLSRNEIKNFSSLANNLGLEVLLEVHNLEEIEKSIMPTIDLFGVNNRNLKTFEVSLETSRSLAEKIPDQFLKVSESGISDPNSIKELIEFGYRGFLIGENFMKSDHPGDTAKDFIKKITQ